MLFAWASEISTPNDFTAAITSEASITPLKKSEKYHVKVSEKTMRQNTYTVLVFGSLYFKGL